MKRLVIELWRGDVSLATTFWEYGVIYAIFVNAFASIASLMLFSADQALWGLIVHFVPAPYDLFMMVAVWRAAGKYQGKHGWATAARVAAVIIYPIASVA